MNNLIKTLREKLELDNPDRYINGYYQLSKKQKKLWVGGLFLGAWVFAIVRFIVSDKEYSFDVVLITSVLCSIAIVFLSFISTLPFFAIRHFIPIVKEKLGEI